MSLDVYLYVGEDRIDPCEHCGGTGKINRGRECVHDGNITHNVAAMADEAGIYQCLWHPEELGITKACQLIEPLRSGLKLLRSDPERFKALNPSNGWGDYDGLVRWAQCLLDSCDGYPEADIRVSR